MDKSKEQEGKKFKGRHREKRKRKTSLKTQFQDLLLGRRRKEAEKKGKERAIKNRYIVN